MLKNIYPDIFSEKATTTKEKILTILINIVWEFLVQQQMFSSELHKQEPTAKLGQQHKFPTIKITSKKIRPSLSS